MNTETAKLALISAIKKARTQVAIMCRVLNAGIYLVDR